MGLYEEILDEFGGYLWNFIGDKMGFPRCRITGKTVYKDKVISVRRSDSEGVPISVRALAIASPLEIATAVLRDTENSRAVKYYSPEKIASMIPDQCILHESYDVRNK
jgi:hypothetical protein